MNIVEACSTFCPVKVVDSDDLVVTSWVAVGLFIMSEALTFMNVEPNGLLQLVRSFCKRLF